MVLKAVKSKIMALLASEGLLLVPSRERQSERERDKERNRERESVYSLIHCFLVNSLLW